MKERYEVIGVMSGSSLDGLDLAWCGFSIENGQWSYSIRKATTIPYDQAMKTRLIAVMSGSSLELARLHRDLGDIIGNACKELLQDGTVDLIASHGHTVFHQPGDDLTTQVGCGARIAARSGVTTVCDFRTTDVALGGQGAPLVPLGEKLLFPQYNSFLNIGGICNISFHGPEKITGFDLCIGNQALNFLAEEAGMPFDDEGRIARSGIVHLPLLEQLDDLPLLQIEPRSIGREWFNEAVLPLIADSAIPLADRMHTVVVHIARQLARNTDGKHGTMLVTGGGAHNTFLLEEIRRSARNTIMVPDKPTIDHKEALIFGLLGLLRWRRESNSLGSVTGAARDTVGGAVYSAN